MHRSTRVTPVRLVALLCPLLVVCLSLLGTSAALAATPASVTVRVLGPAPAYEALTAPVQVTTTTAQVIKDGGSCSGTSAGGALELATKGNWEGTWSTKYSDYEVTSIDALSFPFEENAPANYYWSFWRNNLFAEVGICEAELEAGDQVLFVPSCYGSSCPPEPSGLLGIQAPTSAEVGKPTLLTVERYNAKGEPSPLAGATVSGGGVSAETNSEGHASLTFAGDGSYTLRASGPAAEEPKSIPGEVLICAHAGNDGTCGTTTAPGKSNPPLANDEDPTVRAPYTGPYALLAAAGIHEGHVYSTHSAPRVLAGKVSTQSSVTSISLRLRRSYKGRCWAYSGSRERLQPARCRQGDFFKVASGGDSFSYLLPARLPRGRYVLDIQATDSAGNHTTLARGSSRIVFYVK
ncbi:MAG TPA: hypothetical protein VGL57_09130 [Solirubrobacteraceae bacterium]|jgi:hypothetical protein